jgi:thiol-disulfide isomerase/thioredoxin
MSVCVALALTAAAGPSHEVPDEHALGMETLAESLPPLHLVGSRGERVSSAAWGHKLVVLHFWASWCKPCRKELPELATLARRLDPARAEVVLVAIDDDKSAEVLTAYARELGVELPIYVASASDIPSVFWSWGVPATYIVDGPARRLGRCLGPRAWGKLAASLIAMAGTK